MHLITLNVTHTLGRTPLDEGSARRRKLYLTTHNTEKRRTSMPPGRIRTSNPSKRAAADPRLRPRNYRDREKLYSHITKYNNNSSSGSTT